jgi:DNA polymerase-3 subunit gamma/tau
VEPSALELIVRAAEGSLRDALSALDQVIAFSGNEVTDEMARTILGVIDRELISGFYAAVKARDCARLVGIIDTVFEKGYQPVDFLEDLMAHGRDLLLARTVAEPQRYLSGTPEEIRALAESASVFSEDELLRLLELMTREIPRVKSSSHPRFLLEALGIKLARLGDLQPIEELIARLESDSGAAPSTPGPSSGTRPGTVPQGGTRLSPQPGRPATAGPRLGATEVQAPSMAGPATREPAPSAQPASPAPFPASMGASPVEPASAPPASQEPVESMLRKVHAERAAIGGILGQAVWIQLSDGILKIAFSDKQSFFKDKVQSREVSDYLRRVAGEIAGREVRVQVDVASPGSFGVSAGVSTGATAGGPLGAAAAEVARPILPASDGPVPPSRGAGNGGVAAGTDRGGAGRAGAEKRPPIDETVRRALVDQAMQEPTVRSLLDVLGGEIVDIEPA